MKQPKLIFSTSKLPEFKGDEIGFKRRINMININPKYNGKLCEVRVIGRNNVRGTYVGKLETNYTLGIVYLSTPDKEYKFDLECVVYCEPIDKHLVV